jgi:hypothetical protein
VTIRFEHPKGEPPPADWEDKVSAKEFRDWMEGKTPKRSKWKAKSGIREDLGYRTRSKMEANWARFLQHHGYQLWTDKKDPPEGKWYRFEGRKFLFGELRGATSFYLTDFEVWPGYFDPTRPYELHEIKGYLDGPSKTKLNRMKKYYADVALELVTSPVFSQITKGYKTIIPHWE